MSSIDVQDSGCSTHTRSFCLQDYYANKTYGLRRDRERLAASGKKETSKEEERRTRNEASFVDMKHRFDEGNKQLTAELGAYWDRRLDLLAPLLNDFLAAQANFSSELADSCGEIAKAREKSSPPNSPEPPDFSAVLHEVTKTRSAPAFRAVRAMSTSTTNSSVSSHSYSDLSSHSPVLSSAAGPPPIGSSLTLPAAASAAHSASPPAVPARPMLPNRPSASVRKDALAGMLGVSTLRPGMTPSPTPPSPIADTGSRRRGGPPPLVTVEPERFSESAIGSFAEMHRIAQAQISEASKIAATPAETPAASASPAIVVTAASTEVAASAAVTTAADSGTAVASAAVETAVDAAPQPSIEISPPAAAADSSAVAAAAGTADTAPYASVAEVNAATFPDESIASATAAAAATAENVSSSEL